MRNKKGFTLVELVVVIAIIGILAAILIPTIMGYVRKSRQSRSNANAKSIFSNLASYATELNIKGDTTTVVDGVYYYNKSVSGASSNAKVDEKIKQGADNMSPNTCVLVRFEDGHFPKVISSEGLNDTYYGSYPEPLHGEQTAYGTGAMAKMNN